MKKELVFKFFIVIFFIGFFIGLFFLLYNIFYSEKDITNIKNIQNQDININKEIDISKTINPNNYINLKEFISYFNTGSGIILDVDITKEVFYTKITQSNGSYLITKFDSELIEHIDTSNESIKNQAIIDIYNSYREENFLYGEPNNIRSGVRILEDNELDIQLQLHNDLLMPYSGENYFEKLSRLELKKEKTIEDYMQLSYLYDFSGDYQKSNILKKQKGIPQINFSVSGRVLNQGSIVKNAKIELLNTGEVVYTDEKGYYELNFKTYPMTRARLRASYEGLSDGYNGLYIIFDGDNQSKQDLNFNLHKYDTKVLIKQNDLKNGNTKIVKSSIGNSFYFKEGLVINNNGNIYRNDFYVYIYEFDRETPGMENFLGLDNFDPVYGYSGDMMVTAGMTYMMMTTLDGEEIFISKKNPIVSKQQINMDLQYNNNEEGTTALTREQFELLLKKSEEPGYNIDRVFLEERGISGLAPWWVLNKTRGIWENRGIKILNEDGLEELLYYNVD